ncbi:MAG: divalent-cation tolerance protein CutA [Spirochaetales bacterium]|nr:divalent-cation tolerance protein CutA [Spirochaetales bacterium]
MSQDKEKYVVAMISAPQEAAELIAKMLIDEQLAACTQILGPVTSLYWWKGEVQKDTEVLLLVKTKKSCITTIKKRLTAIHPYEVPELLFLSVLDGLPAYLKWIDTIINNKT